MTGKSTPTDLSAQVTANVRRLRKMRGWSAQELSNRLTAAGCPISQNTISGREAKSKAVSRVSVDELAAFSAVFDRPITDLLAEEVACEQCAGEPPAGFTCNACGAAR